MLTNGKEKLIYPTLFREGMEETLSFTHSLTQFTTCAYMSNLVLSPLFSLLFSLPHNGKVSSQGCCQWLWRKSSHLLTQFTTCAYMSNLVLLPLFPLLFSLPHNGKVSSQGCCQCHILLIYMPQYV